MGCGVWESVRQISDAGTEALEVCRKLTIPKGPSTQDLGTWVLGNSNCGTGLGQVYDYWVLGPLGNNPNPRP